MKFFAKFAAFFVFIFLNSLIIAQDSNIVNYSLFLEKTVPFGTLDTKIDEGSFQEGQSFTIPAAELPSSPVDFSIYQDLYNALVGGKFEIDYGAINKDIIMKIFIRRINPTEGTYLNLGEDKDTLFSYFEIRIWELPDSNFYPEDSSYYFNEGHYAKFSLPKSDNLIKFLNLTGIGIEDSLGFAFLENKTNDSNQTEDWNSTGIETIETADSIIFKSIHLSRIGGGRRNRIVSKSATTGVKAIGKNGIPQNYELYQNYPNPFNPATKIKYSIPVAVHDFGGVQQLVSLKIYDILGKEVATLVNQEQKAGSYEVEWSGLSDSGRQVPSGIYFYSIHANEFIFTRKMVLLK